MKPFAEWSKLSTMLVTIALGGTAIIAFVHDVEPYTPATRGWVRDWGIIQALALDTKVASSDAVTSAKLETLTFQNYDIQLSLLTSAMQILKGEEIMLLQRLKTVPNDQLLSGRLTEVQSNIRSNENDANAIRCEVAKRKGWPCGSR